jgi:hypothetical protein
MSGKRGERMKELARLLISIEEERPKDKVRHCFVNYLSSYRKSSHTKEEIEQHFNVIKSYITYLNKDERRENGQIN